MSSHDARRFIAVDHGRYIDGAIPTRRQRLINEDLLAVRQRREERLPGDVGESVCER
jgi:hypothetical protein